jgi:hypothetical protein
LIHTEVPPALRGRHLGDTLVKAALEAGRAAGLRIVVVCPFVRAYLRAVMRGGTSTKPTQHNAAAVQNGSSVTRTSAPVSVRLPVCENRLSVMTTGADFSLRADRSMV